MHLGPLLHIEMSRKVHAGVGLSTKLTNFLKTNLQTVREKLPGLWAGEEQPNVHIHGQVAFHLEMPLDFQSYWWMSD